MVLMTQSRMAELRRVSNAYMDDALTRTEEAMAQAYDEMALIETDIDKEINEAIGTNYSDEIQNSLLELKKQITPTYLITQKDDNEYKE